jgi:hypothetical protein
MQANEFVYLGLGLALLALLDAVADELQRLCLGEDLQRAALLER